MTRERAVVALFVTAGLLTGSMVGVVSKSGGLEPVGFTGQLHDLGRECAGTYRVVDGVRQTRQYCLQQWLGASDPRFTGTLTRVVNADEYALGDFLSGGDVSLWVSTVTHTLENKGGAWQGEATVSVTIDDVREGGEVDISPQIVAFTGSADYEGLTAVVWWQSGMINPSVRGVIFPGSLPPPPTDDFELLPAED